MTTDELFLREPTNIFAESKTHKLFVSSTDKYFMTTDKLFLSEPTNIFAGSNSNQQIICQFNRQIFYDNR